MAGVERAVSRAVAKSAKTGTARTDAERLLATCRPNHSLENRDLWWWKIVRHSKHQPPRPPSGGVGRGGLGAALKALARRSAVRVTRDVAIEAEVPDSVEVAAY